MYSSRPKFLKTILKLLRKPGPDRAGGDLSTRLLDSNEPFRARDGHVVVYVGLEATRYEVPLKYLWCPMFRELIEQSQEGPVRINSGGALQLACSTDEFELVLPHADDYCKLFLSPILLPYHV